MQPNPVAKACKAYYWKSMTIERWHGPNLFSLLAFFKQILTGKRDGGTFEPRYKPPMLFRYLRPYLRFCKKWDKYPGYRNLIEFRRCAISMFGTDSLSKLKGR